MGLSAPRQVARSYTLLKYDLQGGFSHQAYGYLSTPEDLPNPVYFPEIISDITGVYRYDFISSEAVSDIKTQIQINAVLSRTGYWSKELVLVPAQELSDGEITFPIDYVGYLDMANTINAELGLGETSSLDITFTAILFTEANAGGTIIDEDFLQTCSMTLRATTMEWVRPFDLQRKGYQEGVSYEQTGFFGYDIRHESNLLFGAITLSAPASEVQTPRALNNATGYRADTVDSMDITFDYNLISDPIVTGAVHTVQADVTLSHVDGTRIVFPVLSGEEYDAGFSLTIPVDIDLMYDIIKRKENVTTFDFEAEYDLTVQVDVHTSAEEPGVIDDTISAILPLTLKSGSLVVGDASGTTKTESLTEKEMVENRTRSTLLLIAGSLLGLTILAWLVAGWQLWEHRKRSPLLALWEATQQTVDSHKEIFVNMTALPAVAGDERVTPVNSLDELVKLSDALLKPVLHQVDGAKHSFCVIDGNVRYEYSVLERPSNSIIARRFKEKKEQTGNSTTEESDE